MAIDVSWVEAIVPAASGTLDGGGTITTPPPPVTGTVVARGVASKKAVGLPALLMSTTQLVAATSVRRTPTVGAPAMQSIAPPGGKVVTVLAKSVPRKQTFYTFFFGRIGRPWVRSRR